MWELGGTDLASWNGDFDAWASRWQNLFKGERLDFNFDSDTEDLDDLADEIFDALYDHTHKYSYEE